VIDTHCHLYLEQFKDDLEEVLDRAAEADITHICMPAINFESLRRMEALKHDRIRFYRMAGIHPTEINEGRITTEHELIDYCGKPGIYAVGETGLDYHWSTEFKQQQQESLRVHCRVAKKVNKPVILHNRKSTSDLLDIIEEEQDGTLTGIWHCFNGSVDEGKRALDMGLHLGIGGVLTFKNAGVDKSVAELPLSKMVLETDAPYLSPEPKRGKRNEPAFIRFTAGKLAEVMDMSVDEVDQRTTQTALELFGING